MYSYCTTPGVGTDVVSSGDKMLKFYVKVFYVMGGAFRRAIMYVDRSCSANCGTAPTSNQIIQSLGLF